MNASRVWTAAFLIGAAMSFHAIGENNETLPMAEQVAPVGPAKETLDWYRNAKFGLFLHWGVYSPLGVTEWHRYRSKVSDEDYHKLAASFNPDKYNAEEWALLAKECGARWITVLAKHHDGFAMYHSDVSDFDIGMTMVKERDFFGELAAACRKHGIKLAFYYSQFQDWDHPGGGELSKSPRKIGLDKYQEYIEQKAIPQVHEILTRFGDIVLVWYDTPQSIRPEDSRRFRAETQKASPGTIMCSRIGHGYGDFYSMGDHYSPPRPFGDPWETATALWAWSYRKRPYRGKSARFAIRQLSEVVALGGNYLLNIGPCGDGSLPEPEVTIMRTIGQWLQIHGEAIYDAGMSPFIDKPYLVTHKPGTLYFHLHGMPEERTYAVHGMKNQVTKSYFLADPAQAPVAFQQDGLNVTFDLPTRLPNDDVSVLVAEYEGDLDVVIDPEIIPTQCDDGTVTIEPRHISTVDPRVAFMDKQNQHLVYRDTEWVRTTAQAIIKKPGTYRLVIRQASTRKNPGDMSVRSGHQKLVHRAKHTGSLDTFEDVPVGYFTFTEPGVHNFMIRARRGIGYGTQAPVLLELAELRLEPVGE